MHGAFFDVDLFGSFAEFQFGIDQQRSVDVENHTSAAIGTEPSTLDGEIVVAHGQVTEAVRSRRRPSRPIGWLPSGCL